MSRTLQEKAGLIAASKVVPTYIRPLELKAEVFEKGCFTCANHDAPPMATDKTYTNIWLSTTDVLNGFLQFTPWLGLVVSYDDTWVASATHTLSKRPQKFGIYHLRAEYFNLGTLLDEDIKIYVRHIFDVRKNKFAHLNKSIQLNDYANHLTDAQRTRDMLILKSGADMPGVYVSIEDMASWPSGGSVQQKDLRFASDKLGAVLTHGPNSNSNHVRSDWQLVTKLGATAEW